ncbi:MAG: restriction endonuclease subunit S, partial [Bacteroidetes bacterium]|nr:restriction endonuclease subunit S [Bacteroidota bacterium]
IVTQIEKQKAIIEGADLVLKNWEIDETAFANLPFSELDKHLTFVSSGATPLGGSNVYVQENGVLFIRSQNVLINKTDFSDAVLIPNEVHQKMKRTQVRKGDVFLNITGASIGRSAVMKEEREANVNQHVAILRPNESILPEYLSAVLNTPNLQRQIDKLQTGSSRQGLNFDQIRKLIIPITETNSQLEIIENLKTQLRVLNGISKMKSEAQKKINQILSDVWGVEFIEPINELVEDEQEN